MAADAADLARQIAATLQALEEAALAFEHHRLPRLHRDLARGVAAFTALRPAASSVREVRRLLEGHRLRLSSLHALVGHTLDRASRSTPLCYGQGGGMAPVSRRPLVSLRA